MSINGLSDFVIVNDSSPATQVWDIQRGLFVANTGAGNYATWLSSGLGVGTPWYTSAITILSAASSDAGATTTFTVPATTFGPNLSLTVGNTFNIQGTGLYDGNQQITALTATTIKIGVAFAGNATGIIVGAQIVATAASLYAAIDSYNQNLNPTPIAAVSISSDYQITNTPPGVLVVSATVGNLSLTLPQMNLFGSLSAGRPFVILNLSPSFALALKPFGSSSIIGQIPINDFLVVQLEVQDGSQAGNRVINHWVQPQRTPHGNAAVALRASSSLVDVHVTNAALTAGRIWTLDQAIHYPQGALVLISDDVGGVTTSNTLSVAPNSTLPDTINGGASSIVLNRARGFVLLECDGVSNFTIVGGKGALASTDLLDLPIPLKSGGTAADLSATGGTHQFLKQSGAGAAITVGQPDASDVTSLAASATTDTTNASNITSGTLPAARLPNPSASTLGGIESYAAVTNQWINAISTSGVPSSTQPAFSNISGAITAAQLPENPLSKAHGGTGDTDTSWTAWTPTITAQTPGGTPPTFTLTSARYKLPPGKTALFEIDFTVSVVGTGTNGIEFTLPVTAASFQQSAIGKEIANSGKTCNCGIGQISFTVGLVNFYDGTTPIQLNNRVVITGLYETT